MWKRAFLLCMAWWAAPSPAQTMTPDFTPRPYVQITHPEWSKDAVIYQLNTRQFSPEGTFKAAEKQLPRLKALGIDIVWLMPVQPIGVRNRKGTLGSPYSVRDYFGVNPEFGSAQDLKDFIAVAHKLGMRVILDWVANHTAWDNPLVTEHPEWYARDWKGDFRPTPWWDWHDIIDLDYSHPELRRYMADAMRFWVDEYDIDGFRCDVAGFVPLDFWEQLRPHLETVKPVFLLGEWEGRDLHARAFDATYAWSWYDAVHQIAQGKADVNKLYVYYSWNEKYYPRNIFRMLHLSNHDLNAWERTEFEAFGPALPAFMALSVVSEGIPMIYNGQEAGNERRLAFFEKDPIQWREHPNGELYRKLFALKKANPALWNAGWGARMQKVPNNAEQQVLSFVRQQDGNRIFAVFNLSDKPQNIVFKESLHHGDYSDYLSGVDARFPMAQALTLGPWQYRIYVSGGHNDGGS
jgi:glycosidase